MSDIKIGKITLGVCATNTYFIYKEGEKKAVLVDPADQGELICSKLDEQGIEVGAIILTHGHFDHIWGVEAVKERTEAKIYASEDEGNLLKDSKLNCSLGCGRACTIEPDVWLKDEETVSLCGIDIKMLKTPGHTEGSCCYYVEEAGFLVSGDTLFCESVGRTDLPTGSMSAIVRSIKEKLMPLSDNIKVYPGHGGSTTIGYERDNNPFL